MSVQGYETATHQLQSLHCMCTLHKHYIYTASIYYSSSNLSLVAMNVAEMVQLGRVTIL
jgi:hypothetical protein